MFFVAVVKMSLSFQNNGGNGHKKASQQPQVFSNRDTRVAGEESQQIPPITSAFLLISHLVLRRLCELLLPSDMHNDRLSSILTKINENGIASLSQEERDILLVTLAAFPEKISEIVYAIHERSPKEMNTVIERVKNDFVNVLEKIEENDVPFSHLDEKERFSVCMMVFLTGSEAVDAVLNTYARVLSTQLIPSSQKERYFQQIRQEIESYLQNVFESYIAHFPSVALPLVVASRTDE